jgi:alkylated DNA repair dioxygenase AlkB
MFHSNKIKLEMFAKIYKKNLNKKYVVIKKLIPDNICDEILEEATNYARNNKWTKNRHENYPTTDNRITSEWFSYNYINNLIYNKIFESISSMYNVKQNRLGVNEIFVAKYQHNLQNSLQSHKDGSEFSFIISLNDSREYEGGTYFIDLKKNIKLEKGDCLVFSGQNKHRGSKILKGKRYIITGL